MLLEELFKHEEQEALMRELSDAIMRMSHKYLLNKNHPWTVPETTEEPTWHINPTFSVRGTNDMYDHWRC